VADDWLRRGGSGSEASDSCTRRSWGPRDRQWEYNDRCVPTEAEKTGGSRQRPILKMPVRTSSMTRGSIEGRIGIEGRGNDSVATRRHRHVRLLLIFWIRDFQRQSMMLIRLRSWIERADYGRWVTAGHVEKAPVPLYGRDRGDDAFPRAEKPVDSP
jgi:hypothetical protein